MRKSATLLATFRLVDLSDENQSAVIAALGRDLDGNDLRVAIDRLVQRGVAQRRGRLSVLQPRPIAMRLAERQWEEWSTTRWDEVLTGDVSPDLRVQAARQLALLNTTDIARKVVDHVCRLNGPFDRLEGDSAAVHAKVLLFLAEIDCGVVARQIMRSLDGIEDLSEVENDVGSHLVWALEKIAFHPDTFDDGARLLLRLAVAEHRKGRNGATRQFTALFPLDLGNTAAEGDARLAVLDEAAGTRDSVQRLVVVEALIAASRTDHFSRSIGAETHGSRPALDSWRPATDREARDYIEGCVTLLTQIATRDDKSGDAARTGLGHHLGSLVSNGFIDVVEPVIAQLGDAAAEWTEAQESLGHALVYNAGSRSHEMTEEVARRVRKLIAELQPKSLESRVRFLVIEMPRDFPVGEMPRDFPVGEKLDFETRERREVEAVRALAVEIVEKPETLERALPQLCRGQPRMAHSFGKAVAGSIGRTGPHRDWLERIVQAVTDVPETERDFNLLSGYVSGLAEYDSDVVEAFKQRAAQSPHLAPALPLICRRLGIKPSDIEIIIGTLQTGLLPIRYLWQWTLGGVLAEVPASAVAPLFDTMLDHSAEAFVAAVDLIGTYAYDAPDKLDAFRPQISKLAENVTRQGQSWGYPMSDHHFEQVMNWMLGKGRHDPDARATALALANAVVSVTGWKDEPAFDTSGVDDLKSTLVAGWKHERLLKPVVPMLLSGFPEIAWTLIGQAIVSDQRRGRRFEDILGDKFAFDRGPNPAILSLPEDTLFAWCRAHPDRAPAFAARVLPILTSYQKGAQEPLLHPTMARLLDEFGDREDVRQAVALNMHNFGWWGSVRTYYALYQEPLSALCDHPKPKVRRWAKSLLQQLGTEVENARNEDEEREAQQDV